MLLNVRGVETTTIEVVDLDDTNIETQNNNKSNMDDNKSEDETKVLVKSREILNRRLFNKKQNKIGINVIIQFKNPKRV